MRTLRLAALAAALLPSFAAAQQEPPRRLDFSADTALRAEPRETPRAIRNAFVRDQTVLGLTVYGPSFAALVGEDAITASAGYLVMAGGSFFAAAEYARRREITEATLVLSTAMAWRTAGGALLLAAESEAGRRQTGAATLLGGLGGTALGLRLGRGLTAGEAAATTFGHDLAVVSAIAASFAVDPALADSAGIDERHAAAWVASGALGYLLGRSYAQRVPYNVTVGDVETLWLGAGVGALGAGTFLVAGDPSTTTTALGLLGGALAGTVAADRWLVRRFDHTRSEGAFVALGSLAGSVMGIGVGVLVAGEANRDGPLTLGFATAGAVGGIVLTERYLQTARDAGRTGRLGALSLDPRGALAAVAGVPGRHPLLRYVF
jgi:hypothetical protein